LIIDGVEPIKDYVSISPTTISKRYKVNVYELIVLWLPFHHIDLVPVHGKKREVFVDDFLSDKLSEPLTKPLIVRKKLGKIKKISLKPNSMVIRPRPLDYYRIVYELQTLFTELNNRAKEIIVKLREVRRSKPPDRRRRILALRMELIKLYAGISALKEVFGKEVMERKVVHRIYFKRYVWKPILIALTDDVPLIIDICRKGLREEPVYSYLMSSESGFLNYLNDLISEFKRSEG